jgi:hypothetical protein
MIDLGVEGKIILKFDLKHLDILMLTVFVLHIAGPVSSYSLRVRTYN